MERTNTFSQKTRITKGRTGAETADRTAFNADLRQQMAKDDVHYHAEKLGLGEHGTHEGWIKAEEVASTAANSTANTETRHQMLEVAAYYLAEKRGFAGNGACEDWMNAEAEIDAMLHGRL